MKNYVAFGYVPPDADNPVERILPTVTFSDELGRFIDLQSLALVNMTGTEEERAKVTTITVYVLPVKPLATIQVK